MLYQAIIKIFGTQDHFIFVIPKLSSGGFNLFSNIHVSNSLHTQFKNVRDW